MLLLRRAGNRARFRSRNKVVRFFETRPLSGALGAEILGIDLSTDLDDAVIAALRRELLEHVVIFFRDQKITPQEHLKFAQRFGEPMEYPMLESIDGHPEIIPVAKFENDKINFGGLWHSDTTYTEQPPMGAVLVARELPPRGGDTLFANQYLAYESLSDGMKGLLSNLRAVNASSKPAVARTRINAAKKTTDELLAVHPVVRTHPETGHKLLYVNFGHTLRFENMTEDESIPLLHFLFHHQVQPEFTCRFHWRPGSIAFWDNRASQHHPINDYHGYRRIMHRITLAGDKPF